MTQTNTQVIDVVGLRAKHYSPDEKRISISAVTEHSNEMMLSVPIACLEELVADLRQLQSAGESTTYADTPRNQSTVAPEAKEDPNPLNIIVPKQWMLRSGLPNYPLIIMVFDPNTKTQAGYALSVTAAREMAVGLVKYADTVAKHEKTKQKPNQAL